ncbi:protein of unknown function DUF323 [Rippkaea orientalis PCC 8801]|uniref:Sulfatase-modifying factor enzyme domain-containing protein n=1 Tax=Rippkaea orientalis (strain PCC 8801 / RF-1) TaxID=41431 RepID=B7JY54_RIPO1|nr:SUMF1/EgtB/PvdO family nonheme iron enzyme [Rippkaea orientalis]ACK67156.1 protein of unknown function DUF323 [Rippkaea orientalis PCC 8801]
MRLTSPLSKRQQLLTQLNECRCKTLELFINITDDIFCQQAHPDFSPIGWHLGHIGFTEAYWILEQCAGLSPQFSQYNCLFHAMGLPKIERQNLPTKETIFDYLQTIREQVLTYLEIAPIEQQERLWYWLLQHESQHNETISFVLQLLQRQENGFYPQLNFSNLISSQKTLSQQMVKITAGEFEMGSNTLGTQDNERPTHRVYLDDYWLDIYPVTCLEYRQFMQSRGYQKRQFWSKEGWQWLENNPVSSPLYWVESSDWDNHPVCGVSYYEAEAYANFIGKRLPTEAEWEKAASWDNLTQQKYDYPWGNTQPTSQICNFDNFVGHTTPVNTYEANCSPFGCYDMLGNVWEWTASWFVHYKGFESYPYQGYSESYFDHQHRVLRGGSWATRPWGLRNSFRNWYHPWTRQILVGFRCAK